MKKFSTEKVFCFFCLCLAKLALIHMVSLFFPHIICFAVTTFHVAIGATVNWLMKTVCEQFNAIS